MGHVTARHAPAHYDSARYDPRRRANRTGNRWRRRCKSKSRCTKPPRRLPERMAKAA